MLNNPLVSIVTVCKNAEKSIEKTIQSVINQSYNNIEFIIIDGKSTDKTIELINLYIENISYFISESDKGIADAWNKGINKSNGSFIQILNADDFLDEKKIEASINCFKNNEKSDFVFGDLFMVNNNNDITYKITGDSRYISKVKNRMPRINHPTIMAKKELYDKFGLFDPKYTIAMDYEWLLRITNNGAVGFYSPAIYVYMLEGGVSQNIFKALKQERNISIFYGSNCVIGFTIYFIRIIKVISRLLLEKFIDEKYLSVFRPGKIKYFSGRPY